MVDEKSIKPVSEATGRKSSYQLILAESGSCRGCFDLAKIRRWAKIQTYLRANFRVSTCCQYIPLQFVCFIFLERLAVRRQYQDQSNDQFHQCPYVPFWSSPLSLHFEQHCSYQAKGSVWFIFGRLIEVPESFGTFQMSPQLKNKGTLCL